MGRDAGEVECPAQTTRDDDIVGPGGDADRIVELLHPGDHVPFEGSTVQPGVPVDSIWFVVKLEEDVPVAFVSRSHLGPEHH